MPHVVCPSCSAIYELPAEDAGRMVQCKQCFVDFRVTFGEPKRLPIIPKPQVPVEALTRFTSPEQSLRIAGFGNCVKAAFWLGTINDLAVLFLTLGFLAAIAVLTVGPVGIVASFTIAISTLSTWITLRVCGAASELILAAAHRNARDGIRGDLEKTRA